MNLDALALSGADTAAAQVERDLREQMIQLDLTPGTRLSEQEIATRLGTSRQPVREALIALAKSKLVEIRPNRGGKGPQVVFAPVTADAAPVVLGESLKDLGAAVAVQLVRALGGQVALDGERLAVTLPT